MAARIQALFAFVMAINKHDHSLIVVHWGIKVALNPRTKMLYILQCINPSLWWLHYAIQAGKMERDAPLQAAQVKLLFCPRVHGCRIQQVHQPARTSTTFNKRITLRYMIRRKTSLIQHVNVRNIVNSL